ncbi:unnamed protein product [Staurois parvus]|uniref:Uncharacterized protein n=1 Tax=Staurois parvus TaxID=386267 RepID=A0ABN9EVA7_9NEOB|nr:unnamed protein product [Staurois parvus]
MGDTAGHCWVALLGGIAGHCWAALIIRRSPLSHLPVNGSTFLML